MVNRLDQNSPITSDAPGTAPNTGSPQRHRKFISADLATNDDLIVTLSDAYENKRARQVFEWERTRRGNAQSLFV